MGCLSQPRLGGGQATVETGRESMAPGLDRIIFLTGPRERVKGIEPS